jgi:SAM-dependent methyltransferase
MDYHGYLDKFAVVGRCLYAEGWANRFEPELYYDGERLRTEHQTVPRPDLTTVFGPDAVNWGFVLVAIVPHLHVDRSKFTLRFSEGFILKDPSGGFSNPGDRLFQVMVDRFRGEVAERRGSMLEIGSRARSGVSYRSWFPADIEHLGIDITDGPNVDAVCDAHHLSRRVDRTFDFAFSMAVFEHLLMPWKVALEMNKVLRQGALGLIISHAAWPLHEEPWDFFRFSKESWRGIFNAHTGFEVVDAQYRYPASIVPDYINDSNFQQMSLGPTYLLSGCIVRRTGPAQVAWNAEVADIYDLSYSHA